MDEIGGSGDLTAAQKEKDQDPVLAHQAIEPTVVSALLGETTAECAAEGLGGVYRISKPHRIIHCSDGIVEEFSEDEIDEVDAAKIQEPPVDPTSLTWGPWLVYQTQTAGGYVLKACDYLGEGLANFFGITRPKYEYEIEEYKRTLQEEEERQKKEDLEMGGWRENAEQTEPQTKAPAAAPEEATETPAPEKF